MFIPTSEVARQSCQHIFTALASCSPLELFNQRVLSRKHKRKTREMKQQKMEKALESAVERGNLPKRSAKRLRAFLSHFLMPQLDANRGMLTIVPAHTKPRWTRPCLTSPRHYLRHNPSYTDYSVR
jgi:hypothetical protein